MGAIVCYYTRVVVIALRLLKKLIMARTITLTDQQSGNLLSLIRRECFAPYALQGEREAMEELYQVLTLAPHIPDAELRPYILAVPTDDMPAPQRAEIGVLASMSEEEAR
jgi:hypothetical protein